MNITWTGKKRHHTNLKAYDKQFTKKVKKGSRAVWCKQARQAKQQSHIYQSAVKMSCMRWGFKMHKIHDTEPKFWGKSACKMFSVFMIWVIIWVKEWNIKTEDSKVESVWFCHFTNDSLGVLS